MTGRLSLLAVRFRDRIEDKAEEHGLMYPWWIAVLSTVGMTGSAVVATAQRHALVPPQLVAVSILLVLAPCVADFVLRRWVPWWILTGLASGAVAWLLLEPVSGNQAADVSAGVLGVVAAEVTATEGARRGLLSAVVGVAVCLLFSDAPAGTQVGFAGIVVLGFTIGYMLRWQMRALAAEHSARKEEHERATLAERQRVAREIHDLVAHSLSVTLLHVTGARRALTEDADIHDAIEALTDAERIGRQAMADIRRTVSVLNTDGNALGPDLRPLPGAADLDALVGGFVAAGMRVTWTTEGDLAGLPEAAGLGLYRVTQEALSNVAKHAPGAPVVGRLAVGRRHAHLTVTNPLLVSVAAPSGGSGLGGMAARAEQLGGSLTVGELAPDDPDSGPGTGSWRVDLRVPIDDHACALRRALS